MNTPVSSGHISRCEKILLLLGNATSEENRERDCTFVQKARKDLEKIRQHGDPPEITVAVYGDTGAGKSSLLNALLDQPYLLPTAGMGRACTSVAIKIEENKTSSSFEADIEFLTAEDWERDLNVLRHDLRQNDGDNDEDNDGDNDEDNYVYNEACAMFTLMYGDFEPTNLDTLLADDTDTAELLGADKKLLDSSARELRDKISTYSEKTDDDCQFWPIVKQVVLKVPDSGLCRSGVNLVDLPGVGDSNAARADVARKYIQTCDVLLVVTKIERAVDNETVEQTLGDKLFSQLLMDHTETVVACTHTDDVKPSEVIRKLPLPQAAEWTAKGQRYKEEEKVLQQKLADLKRDKQVDCRSENSLIQQQQRLHAAIDQLKREKTSTCAVERNKFVRNSILPKISSPPSPHDQECPHDPKVFCVSSSDYINLSNLVTSDDDDDDKSPVFLSTEDTEIPGLRTYLQDLVWKKQEEHRMSLQDDFQAIIDGILMYIINSKRGTTALREELERHLDTLQDEGQLILDELDSHLQSSWIAVLGATLDEATWEAIKQAKPTVESWAGLRSEGGLAYKTYRATVCRMGIFRSSSIGRVINMNQDLADPFVKILSKEWTPRFSEQAWIETVKSKIKEPASIAITRLTDAIMRSLGDSDATLLKDLTQLQKDTLGKLTRLDSLWEKTIKRQQRAITHMIPDFVQEQMQSAYVPCSEQGGPGAFKRVKDIMASTIDQLKSKMFKQLKEKITVYLGQLKKGFMKEAKEILEDIVEDTEKQIMPLSQTRGETIYLETLERSEGLIQTLSDDFAKYKTSEERDTSGPE